MSTARITPGGMHKANSKTVQYFVAFTVDFAHLKRYIEKQQRQPLHGGKERTMDRKNQTFSVYMITDMARFYFAGYYFGVQKSEQCGC